MGGRKVLAVLLAAVLAMSLAACSSDGGDDEGAAEPQGDQSELSADGDSSSEDGDSDDAGQEGDVADGDLPDLGDLDECLEAAAAFAQLVFLPTALSVGGDEADLAELEESLEELDAKIPDELSEDYEVVRDAYEEFAEAMSGIDMSDPSTFLDPGVSEQLEAAGEALDTDEVQAALDNIDAYFTANCES